MPLPSSSIGVIIMRKKILVVEDDAKIVNIVTKTLKKNGFSSVSAETTSKARSILQTEAIDLILLDINLPDGDGVDFTREVRKSLETPIIFVSGRTDVYDTIIGLEIGGDDFVKKPFEPRELIARIHSVLRRTAPKQEINGTSDHVSGTATLDKIVIDFTRFDAFAIGSGEPCNLTSAEFGILKSLATTKLATVSREILLNEIFGGTSNTADRSVDSHIVRLRKKLSSAGCRNDLIKTVYRVGYRITEPVKFN